MRFRFEWNRETFLGDRMNGKDAKRKKKKEWTGKINFLNEISSRAIKRGRDVDRDIPARINYTWSVERFLATSGRSGASKKRGKKAYRGNGR